MCPLLFTIGTTSYTESCFWKSDDTSEGMDGTGFVELRYDNANCGSIRIRHYNYKATEP